MNKTPFRCVQVKNIPAANLRIASLAKHFQYYGDITNITLDEAQHSAVVQFEHSKAAYAALRSHSAVFKNRFVIVEPLYNPNDPATFEKLPRKRGEKGKPNPSRASSPGVSSGAGVSSKPGASSSDPSNSSNSSKPSELSEPSESSESAMKLVATRQHLQQEEIAVIRSSIQKRLELLQKYALLAQTIAPAELPKLRTSLSQLLEPLYQEAGALYELLKTSGIKEEGSEGPESEVKRLLSAVFQLFEDSELFAELKTAVTSRLYSIFEKQYRQLNRSKRPFAGASGFSKKRRAAMYEIDNRPRSIRIAQLPAGATQDDVAVALKGFFGVQRIDVEGGSATISFLQPWQTTKPVRGGLWIRNQVGRERRFVPVRKCIRKWSRCSPAPPQPLLSSRSPLLRRAQRGLQSRQERPKRWDRARYRPANRRERRLLPLLLLLLPILLVFALCVEQTTCNNRNHPLKITHCRSLAPSLP